MRRDEAIEAIKRIYLAETTEAKSVAAALATALFEDAKDGSAGFTRDELLDATSALRKSWDEGEIAYQDIERGLSRLGKRLKTFTAEQDLSPFHVSGITGPRRKDRLDDDDRLFLRVDFQPPDDETPGSFARAIDGAIQLPPAQRVELNRQISSGEARVVASEAVKNPTGKGLLITIIVGLLALGLLASPSARRWIHDHVAAILSPAPSLRHQGVPRNSGTAITVRPEPQWVIIPGLRPQEVRAAKRTELPPGVVKHSGTLVVEPIEPEGAPFLIGSAAYSDNPLHLTFMARPSQQFRGGANRKMFFYFPDRSQDNIVVRSIDDNSWGASVEHVYAKATDVKMVYAVLVEETAPDVYRPLEVISRRFSYEGDQP